MRRSFFDHNFYTAVFFHMSGTFVVLHRFRIRIPGRDKPFGGKVFIRGKIPDHTRRSCRRQLPVRWELIGGNPAAVRMALYLYVIRNCF